MQYRRVLRVRDRGRCSAGTDQYQLHSLKIDALFLDTLPVAHAIGVVALELSGDIAVLIAEIYDRIKSRRRAFAASSTSSRY